MRLTQSMIARRLLVSFAAFGLLATLFQNCSIKSMSTVDLLSEIQFKGNGDVYDGKPDQVFNRYLPGFSCEGKPAPKQSILQMANGQIELRENTLTQCGSQIVQVQENELVRSPFQQEFLVRDDRLFKKYEEIPIGIPSNLAELMCRDQFLDPNFELIAHYDSESKQAVIRYYDARKSKAARAVSELITQPDSPVKRIISYENAKYQNEKIDLQVNFLENSLEHPLRYSAQLKMSLDESASMKLDCVVGGGIDRSGWPLLAQTSVPTADFSVYEDNQVSKVYFTGLPQADLLRAISTGEVKNVKLFSQVKNNAFPIWYVPSDNGMTRDFSLYDLTEPSKEIVPHVYGGENVFSGTPLLNPRYSLYLQFQELQKYSFAGMNLFLLKASRFTFFDQKLGRTVPYEQQALDRSSWVLSGVKSAGAFPFVFMGSILLTSSQNALLSFGPTPDPSLGFTQLRLDSGSVLGAENPLTQINLNPDNTTQRILLSNPTNFNKVLVHTADLSQAVHLYDTETGQSEKLEFDFSAVNCDPTVPDLRVVSAGPLEPVLAGDHAIAIVVCSINSLMPITEAQGPVTKLMRLDLKTRTTQVILSGPIDVVWRSKDRRWIVVRQIPSIDMRLWGRKALDMYQSQLIDLKDLSVRDFPLNYSGGILLPEDSNLSSFGSLEQKAVDLDFVGRINSSEATLKQVNLVSESTKILGINTVNGVDQILRLDPGSLTLENACPKIEGRILALRSLGQDRTLAIVHDAKNSNFQFFQIDPVLGCRLMNSFPTESNRILRFTMTEVGLAIILARVDLSQPEIIMSSDFYFVPYNGGTPFLLTSNGSKITAVQKAVVSKNRQQLLILGTLQDSGMQSLFSFDLK